MAKFYLMGNYTAKAFQGFIANPDTDRGAAIKAVASAVGGKVLDYDIVRGSYDFIVSIDAPNFESMAAAKLATEASG
ncbi:MAG: GYD domain-containing protein, partial [Alphaproteobacteria bacterium]